MAESFRAMPNRLQIRTLARLRALALPALVLAMFASMAIPQGAHAEDTFRLTNKALTAEFDQFFQAKTEAGCWYDPNGVFGTGENFFHEDSEITGDDDPFRCDNASWHSVLDYEQGGSKVGLILFQADDPALGDATLECQGEGAETETGLGFLPIERFLTTEVDGRTCTVAPLPGLGAAGTDFASSPGRAYAGHVRLVSSLAPVVGRRAQVQVEVFGLGAARHRVSVDLRMESGMAVGSASRMLRVGDHPRTISVPISAAAWHELEARREFRVHAAVSIQSPGGTGDTTTQLLLRRASGS
jgi:hypothetical protein